MSKLQPTGIRRHFSGRDSQWAGLVFSLPFVLGFLLIFLSIFITSIRFAFSTLVLTDSGYRLVFEGLDNFWYALRVDPNFFEMALAETRSLATSLPTILIFSLFVAVVLNRALPGRTVFRAIFFLPVVVSVGMISKLDSDNLVMSAMSSLRPETGMDVTQGALDSMGDITRMLQGLQFSPDMVAFVSSLAGNITNVIGHSGVQILISLAALQSIPASVFEAADVEGATAWEKFWKITLPMVAPMMVVNVFYTIIEQITTDTSQLFSYTYSLAFSQGQFGRSAAMTWIYFFMVLLLFGIVALAALLITRGRKKQRGREAPYGK